MQGGTGAVTFVFVTKATDGKLLESRDTIADLQPGIDHINLSGFIAGERFVSTAAFTLTAKEVHFVAATGQLESDTNGDGSADWTRQMTKPLTLTAADFLF